MAKRWESVAMSCSQLEERRKGANSGNILHALETMFDEQVQDIQAQMTSIISKMQKLVEGKTPDELAEAVTTAFSWGKQQAAGWKLMRGARAVRQRVLRMKRAEDACQDALVQMREHAEQEMKIARNEENQRKFSNESRVRGKR